jgi:hypothetical protein
LIGRGIFWLRVPIVTHVESPPARTLELPVTGAAAAQQLGEQILARNIFDSAGGSISWDERKPVAPGEVSAASEGGAAVANARCAGDLRLLASVVRTGASGRSIAALRKDGKTHILSVGERLGELELIAVYPTGAYFRDGTQAPCGLQVYLSANEAPPPPLPPPPVSEATPAKPALSTADAAARLKRPPAFSEEELKRNIRVLGPARYAVTRELFARARLNPSGISRGARFKPQMKEGRSAGMHVAKLRDDSLLAHLGVKEGDVLRGMNGFGFGSADGVLEAFGHLGKKSEVTLSIERDGAPATIQYVLE